MDIKLTKGQARVLDSEGKVTIFCRGLLEIEVVKDPTKKNGVKGKVATAIENITVPKNFERDTVWFIACKYKNECPWLPLSNEDTSFNLFDNENFEPFNSEKEARFFFRQMVYRTERLIHAGKKNQFTELTLYRSTKEGTTTLCCWDRKDGYQELVPMEKPKAKVGRPRKSLAVKEEEESND